MPVFARAMLVLLLLGTAALVVVRALWPLTVPAPATRRRDPALKWRLAGIVAGAAAALVAVRIPEAGRGDLLAAPVFGMGVFAGALTGELTRGRPAGAVRRAGLRVRRTLDYVPRALGTGVTVSTVALFALATLTTRTGAPEAGGRVLACPGGTRGPWPGAYYTVPALAAVVAGLALAAFTLRRVVRRPQAAEPATADDALRRRSAEVVTAGTGVLVLVPLTGIALTAGLLLQSSEVTCGAGWWDGAGQALTALGFLAFAFAAWYGACLLLPGKRARA
ncbi:hypothetical protein GCM10020358_43300 [Amorphoplanes nipponensis]|uniref:Uncharacterized protein n=1 Tax=Actinoplanes nipponensis TaxID=135950 RepID=A0A919JNA5_9ACTN|nr:hypothetical protein [Actinoplanes nipponensis]GIE53771.1 hypothetical protein Ani05nite_73050 [Actinoplanes nipponensis]